MVNSVKSWKTLSECVLNRVCGIDKTSLSQDEYENLDVEYDVGIDEILPVGKKIMNLNILDKNINFRELEKFPKFWRKIYSTCIDVVLG